MKATQQHLQVFMLPKPASNTVTVSFQAPAPVKTIVRILTIEGICLLNEQLGDQQNGYIDLPIQSLPSGIYMLEFTSGDQKVVHRLVREYFVKV